MAGKEVKFLYLSQEDTIKAGVLDVHRCVAVIEEAFKLVAQGDYLMGGPGGNEHGLKIFFPEIPRGPHMPVAGPDRRFRAVIGYLGGEFNVCGEKWYGSNIANRERNLPRSISIIALNNAETAEPLVIMDGTLVSAMRTGAVPAVGARYLAKKNCAVIAVVGAGVINRACLMCLADVLHIKEVKVFDLMESKAKAFSSCMSEKIGLGVHHVDTLEEAIVDSDVVSLATSGPKRPFIKSEWFKEGSYVAVSSPSSDLQDNFYMTSRIVVDNWKMHIAYRKEADGQAIPYAAVHRLVQAEQIKEEDIDDLGPIISGTRLGRVTNRERIVLLASGLPIWDIAWSYVVYKEALKKGIGQELTLWKEPFWK